MLHTAPGLVPGVDELPRSLTGVRLPLALWLASATPRCEPLMSARRRHPATRGGRTDLLSRTQVVGPNHVIICSLAVQPSTRVLARVSQSRLAKALQPWALGSSLSLLNYYSCTDGLFAPRHVAARHAAASRPWKRRALTLACEYVRWLTYRPVARWCHTVRGACKRVKVGRYPRPGRLQSGPPGQAVRLARRRLWRPRVPVRAVTRVNSSGVPPRRDPSVGGAARSGTR